MPMKTKIVKPKIPLYQFQINAILRRFRFPELRVLANRPWLESWSYAADDGKVLVTYTWTQETGVLRICDKKTGHCFVDVDNPKRKQITAAMRSVLRREPEPIGFGKQMSINDCLMEKA
jgi:hypothetical protein